MTKKYILLNIIGLSLLFLGCSGESSDEIRKKDKVVILQELNEAGCLALETYSIKLKTDNHIKNIKFSPKKSKKTCLSYGKTKSEIISIKKIDSTTDIECSEIPFINLQETFAQKDLSIFQDNKKSCIITFDII